MHRQRGVSRAIQPKVHDFDQQTIGRHSPQTVGKEEVIVKEHHFLESPPYGNLIWQYPYSIGI